MRRSAQQATPLAFAARGEEIAIERVVPGLDEDRLVPIAALGNMMRDAWNNDASDARHGTLAAGRGDLIQLTLCHRNL